VLLAPGVAGAQDLGAPPPRVSAVELLLPPGDDREAAATLLAVAPGEPLAMRALRRTVQRLFQTGRYRNVVVRAAPSAPAPGEGGSRVALTVEALPLRKVTQVAVRVDAKAVLDERAVRAVAGMAEGDPFDDGALDGAAARIRAALARRGYREVAVEAAAHGDANVTVEISVRAGTATRVSAVRVEGEPGAATAALERLRIRPGVVLDEDLLAEDVRALRRELHAAGYRRPRVGTPRVTVSAGTAEVVFPVRAGPRVALLFRGNAAVPAALLERQLGIEPDQPVDATTLDAAAERLRIFYRARGFAAARVEVEEVPRGAHLAVVFRVDEGLRYRVEQVRFEGAGARSEDWLRRRLVAYLAEEAPPVDHPEADAVRALAVSIPSAPARPVPPAPLPAGEYHEEAAWDRAAQRIVDGYRAEGFLEAVYLGSSLALDARRRTARVTLQLREGPQIRVEAIAFEGNRAVTLPELSEEARIRPGEPLAFERVEETRSALQRLYTARGHAFARIEAREELDRKANVAVVRFVVEEGPQVRIGRILVAGNRRTRTDVVRRALEVEEGAVFRPGAVARSEAALLGMGVFRSVNIRLQEPETPQETKDLVVELAERPYATLSHGLGFSIANGPRAGIEYTRPNLLGRAVELSLRGKVNYPVDVLGQRPDLSAKPPEDRVEGRADVGLRTARLGLLPFPAGARANLIGETLHRRAYSLGRISGVAGLDLGVTSRMGFSLQYELEVDRIDRTGAVGPLTQADVERLRFDEGTTTLHAVRPSFSLDFRDNSTHPRRGWFAAGSVEYARSLGEGGRRILLGVLPGSDIHTNLVKAAGTLSGYLPLGQASALALSVRAGRVWPVDDQSRTIVPRRFFLGGASTMRGFGEEQMIQEDVRADLAAQARQCATSPTGAGCTDAGRRIAGGQQPVSEGGEAFLLGKAELRLALSSTLEAGLFLDAGNLWLDPARLDAGELRTNAGVGLRFVTPVGPAAFDLGFNLDPDDRINEPRYAWHFTIGLF
jgi:outer membrane protein assembly complex protein YaeT